MNVAAFRRLATPATIVVGACVVLSVIWSVPYIFTLIGLSAWVFVGHLITADDDAPGGWSNPDGKIPFPWRELGAKAFVLTALCVLALIFPAIRNAGGAS